jgi:hypothetical protein
VITNLKLEANLWRRHNRQDSTGLAPIILRATINGVRTELSTGVCCPAAYWPERAHYLVMPADPTQWVLPDYSAEEVARFNDELFQFKRSTSELYKRLRQPEPNGPFIEVSAGELRKVARGGESKLSAKARLLRRPLLEVCRLFVEMQLDKPKAERLTDSTLKNYRYRLNVLKRYLKTAGTKDMPAAEVDVPWCRRYERWLTSEQGGFGGMAMRKQINFLQLALDFAVAEGWLPTKTLHGYKYQTRASIPLALSLPADEVARLAAAIPKLCDTEQRAVVGWLFCCYTGLSWVDYGNFCASPASYLFTEPAAGPGQVPTHWLRMVRQKMKRRKPQGFSAPLFDDAADLLLKWQGNLPFIANQSVNTLLHLAEEKLQLSQPLTTKLARATFSQLKRDAGYSDEAVAAMMGDSVAVMNRHYSRVSERRLLLEMAQLGSIPTTPEPPKVANKIAAPPSTVIAETELLAPHLTSPVGPQYPIVVGPGCTVVVQQLPLVPQLAPRRRRPPAPSPWRRPAPVTSHDEPEQGARVIRMWGSASEVRKEVASA